MPNNQKRLFLTYWPTFLSSFPSRSLPQLGRRWRRTTSQSRPWSASCGPVLWAMWSGTRKRNWSQNKPSSTWRWAGWFTLISQSHHFHRCDGIECLFLPLVFMTQQNTTFLSTSPQQYSPLLKAFTSQGASEILLLVKMQEYCYDNIHFMNSFQKIVVLLYKGNSTGRRSRWDILG